MNGIPDTVQWATTAQECDEVHALFLRRIGGSLVEDAASFRLSALASGMEWRPRLGLVRDGERLAAAQLGGLLPSVGLLSLPYTAVEDGYEGQGLYHHLKQAMLRRLRADAELLGLPTPTANVSEEVEGSAHYQRKTAGTAIVLPIAYASPAAQGLRETPLALTWEPLTDAPSPSSLQELRRIVAALYRGLYGVASPETDVTFRRIFHDLEYPNAQG